MCSVNRLPVVIRDRDGLGSGRPGSRTVWDRDRLGSGRPGSRTVWDRDRLGPGRPGTRTAREPDGPGPGLMLRNVMKQSRKTGSSCFASLSQNFGILNASLGQLKASSFFPDMFESHWWSRTSTPPLSGMWFQLAAEEGKRGKVVLEGNFSNCSKTNVIVKHAHVP